MSSFFAVSHRASRWIPGSVPEKAGNGPGMTGKERKRHRATAMAGKEYEHRGATGDGPLRELALLEADP
jgi:hypothetical protein